LEVEDVFSRTDQLAIAFPITRSQKYTNNKYSTANQNAVTIRPQAKLDLTKLKILSGLLHVNLVIHTGYTVIHTGYTCYLITNTIYYITSN